MDPNWTIFLGAGLTVVVVILLIASNSASGPTSTQVQGVMSSAAQARQSADFEQACMLYERAKGLIEGSRPLDQSILSACLVNYAECLERSGRRKEAGEERQRLIALWDAALKSGMEDLLTEVDYLCTSADFGSGTRDVADYYERVLAVREKTHSPHSDTFINTVAIYARLMRRLGESDIADDLEKHAEQLRSGGPAKFLIGSNPAEGTEAGEDSGESPKDVDEQSDAGASG